MHGLALLDRVLNVVHRGLSAFLEPPQKPLRVPDRLLVVEYILHFGCGPDGVSRGLFPNPPPFQLTQPVPPILVASSHASDRFSAVATFGWAQYRSRESRRDWVSRGVAVSNVPHR